MQKVKYRIHNNTLFEIAQSRAFTDKDNIDGLFDEEGKIKLVTDRAGADLTLSLIKNEEGLSYEVKWDDSVEDYKGWNMAWEEFMWCLGVVNKPLEEAAKKAAEEAAQRRAEEAALAAAATEADDSEEEVEVVEVETEVATEEIDSEDSSK